MNEIKVYVVGTANSGKSTIMEMIARNLRKLGVTVEVHKTRNEEPSFVQDDLYEKRVASVISRGISVDVIEAQAHRVNAGFSTIDENADSKVFRPFGL